MSDQWQPGDAVIDADGDIYLRSRRGYWINDAGDEWLDRELVPPLTLIARDGKKVES